MKIYHFVIVFAAIALTYIIAADAQLMEQRYAMLECDRLASVSERGTVAAVYILSSEGGSSSPVARKLAGEVYLDSVCAALGVLDAPDTIEVIRGYTLMSTDDECFEVLFKGYPLKGGRSYNRTFASAAGIGYGNEYHVCGEIYHRAGCTMESEVTAVCFSGHECAVMGARPCEQCV